MERTIIIANTSAMPVSSRESSVYLVTLGEYYRQMGLDVLVLADSTSRWAQALREMSGKLEEIPGEEAFPAYLGSRIAGFYGRAGAVNLHSGNTGSLTIIGTVSPAGGNLEEPVTQTTLDNVGTFLGLTWERSNARKFPAIDPLISWSKCSGIVSEEDRERLNALLRQGNAINEMMTVVGEEGTSDEDFITFLKSEFYDRVFLQQNAFDEVDVACPEERQLRVLKTVFNVINTEIKLEKKEARFFFQKLQQRFLDWHSAPWESDEFFNIEKEIAETLQQTSKQGKE